jgi:hypothetical protein
VRVRRYWRPPSQGSTPIKIAHDEFREEFHRLFVESVGERLRSSAPVIVHVSGGLDSSSVAGAADLIGRAGNWPTPYVRGAAGLHPGLTTDEGPFIDAVARRVQFPIERWDATLTGPTDPDLEDPSDAQPGVRALNRGGTIGDIAIARAHGASVVLSGIGGDELGTVFGFVKDLIADRRWSTVLDELLFFPGATMRTRAARLKQVVRQSVPSELLRWVALAGPAASTARQRAPCSGVARSFSSLSSREVRLGTRDIGQAGQGDHPVPRTRLGPRRGVPVSFPRSRARDVRDDRVSRALAAPPSLRPPSSGAPGGPASPRGGPAIR